MSLPWVRLDSNIASHDKILSLLDDPSPKKWQAAFSYTCSIGYCGAQGTDGLIPFGALAFVHGTKATAGLLVSHFLWRPDPLGWTVPKFLERQQSQADSQRIRNARRVASSKGNCIRWHGEHCGCWQVIA
ncbi:MAG TPA: hypothetical protein VFJ19_09450 [Nocardioidaceae bacterium]|nr:hypothetical protein [Nocardioidaceae bacterium]